MASSPRPPRYRIEFKPSAAREFAALDRPVARRILPKIEALAETPRPPGAQMLKGGEGQWRIRVGDWRVVYMIEDDALLILVLTIGHRRDVYR